MKKILFLLLITGLIFSCAKKEKEIVLRIGASPIPHSEILEIVSDDLKAEGIKLEIVNFEDAVLPNQEVAGKGLDANFIQHVPYMNDFNKKYNSKLISIAKIHVEPLALYSKKIKNIEELKEGGEILIPNNATNQGRALLLLDKNGVIKLKDNKKLDSTIEDIIENPKKIKIIPMAGEQIAPRINEVEGAVINGNFAMKSNLTISEDAVLIEDKDSPYANVIVVLEGSENKEAVQKLIKALQSDKVRKFIEENYKGAVIPAF
jgi:D-methionine transport system substrate-binding protein